MNSKREYGDYQTPLEFARKVCEYLKDVKRISPDVVIEPTCGVGAFLKASIIFNAEEYYGIEINPKYCEMVQESSADDRVQIINADLFSYPLKNIIKRNKSTLIIGNPPWVTSSTISALSATNMPSKSNFKKLRGIEAMTGAGNFDICENMIWKIISEYRSSNTTVAMLCKTTVARNIFELIQKDGISCASCDMLEFDAREVFGISASACLLVVQLSADNRTTATCNVYDFEYPEQIKSSICYNNHKISNILSKNQYDFDGKCCFEWRQGVKHDCAKIMEISSENNQLKNGYKEIVIIEDTFLFPLVKSSMFKNPIIAEFSKQVIVTQKKIKEDTEYLRDVAPQMWNYLEKNREAFLKRKSKIYDGTPEFSIFGVGTYSFARYKVGVSGFYKKPMFSLLYSDNKPVMVDDTSYFIGFDDYDMAYVTMLLLNNDKVQEFLSGIAFLDAKRPYTKKVLARIDFHKILENMDISDILETEEKLGLDRYASEDMYLLYKKALEERRVA